MKNSSLLKKKQLDAVSPVAANPTPPDTLQEAPREQADEEMAALTLQAGLTRSARLYHSFLTLFGCFWLLYCGGYVEETATQDEASVATQEIPAEAAPAACQKEAQHAVEVTLAPMVPDVLKVMPGQRLLQTLFWFKVQNTEEEAVTLTELSASFGAACELLGTVALVDAQGGVMSDTACQETVTFTMDTVLQPQQTQWFSLRATMRDAPDDLLAMYRYMEGGVMGLEPYRPAIQGFAYTKDGSQESVSLPAPLEGFPLWVDMSRHCQLEAEQATCTEAQSDLPLLKSDLCQEDTSWLQIANNRLARVEISLLAQAGLEDIPPGDVCLTLEPVGTLAEETRMTVVAANVHEFTLPSPLVRQNDFGYRLCIPRITAETETQYQLFIQAPWNSRGTLAFRINPEYAQASLPLQGCFPQSTQTLLLLPQDEWAASQNFGP